MASAPPTVRDGDPCPCGSGRRFDGCCAPALRGIPASTAETLMRSRYTAFVLADTAYLTETWHPGTRPDSVEPDASLRWTGLEVTATEAGRPGDKRGTVTFRAHWRDGRETGVLQERSRFVFQSSRWWYLDGVVG